MTAFWTDPDFDEHELVQLVHDRASGLTAVIAIHSTHLGGAGGGVRFWRYADPAGGLTDALRLSRGMSYKNAMAGLALGGGKAVILSDAAGTKTPEMLAAFADAVEALGGRYVTAQDVGMSMGDIMAISRRTAFVSGLPPAAGEAGGTPGPFTAQGIFLGIKAAVRHKLGQGSMAGLHVAVQGAGAVGGGTARLLAADGARLTIADMDAVKAQALAAELGGTAVAAHAIMAVPCDVFSPCALGAILDDAGIARLDTGIVAGGANNQLARPEHGAVLAARDILYAPDYVINAGGIVSVAVEYLARTKGQPANLGEVEARIAAIPSRLEAIWAESAASGRSPDVVADAMARKLIGR